MQKSNNLLNCIFSGFQHTVHTYSRMNIKNWDIGKLLLQKRTTSSTSLVLKIHPKSHFKSLPNTTFFHFIIKLFSENTLKMILKPRPKIYCQNLCDENKFLSKELKTFTTFNTFLYYLVIVCSLRRVYLKQVGQAKYEKLSTTVGDFVSQIVFFE